MNPKAIFASQNGGDQRISSVQGVTNTQPSNVQVAGKQGYIYRKISFLELPESERESKTLQYAKIWMVVKENMLLYSHDNFLVDERKGGKKQNPPFCKGFISLDEECEVKIGFKERIHESESMF